MTSTVYYQGNLRTSCTHQQSGSKIDTDAPVDNHGKGELFSPTDLLATSLAACMLTVMGIKAKSMDTSIENVCIEVEKIMASDPRRVSEIKLNVKIPSSLINLENRSKVILKKTAETCPVLNSIHPEIKVVINWNEWTN
jgi:putative redox protein